MGWSWHHTSRVAFGSILGALLVVSSVACDSARKNDCAAFLRVEGTITRDVRTYEDPKTTHEVAQNWRDQAKQMDTAFDDLGRLLVVDEHIALWASRARAILPKQFALGQHIAAARELEDWPTVEAGRRDWDANAARLKGIEEDAAVYCR